MRIDGSTCCEKGGGRKRCRTILKNAVRVRSVETTALVVSHRQGNGEGGGRGEDPAE